MGLEKAMKNLLLILPLIFVPNCTEAYLHAPISNTTILKITLCLRLSIRFSDFVVNSNLTFPDHSNRCICNKNYLGDSCGCIKQGTFSYPRNEFNALIHPCPIPNNEYSYTASNECKQDVGLKYCQSVGFTTFVASEEEFGAESYKVGTMDGKTCQPEKSYNIVGPCKGSSGSIFYWWCRCPYIMKIACSRSLCPT